MSSCSSKPVGKCSVPRRVDQWGAVGGDGPKSRASLAPVVYGLGRIRSGPIGVDFAWLSQSPATRRPPRPRGDLCPSRRARWNRWTLRDVHPFLNQSGPIAYAHRGGAGEAPENTLAAFEIAVTLGYRYLETDAHVTRDGVLVAFHDDRLDRVTDRTGAIAELGIIEVEIGRAHV